MAATTEELYADVQAAIEAGTPQAVYAGIAAFVGANSSGGVQRLWLGFGGATLTAGTTGYANPIGYSTTPLPASPNFYGIPVTGNIVAIHYRVGTAHTTNTVEVRVRLNGVNTDVNFDVAATDTTQSQSITPLAVVPGDAVACAMIHGGATNLATISVWFEIEY